MSKKLLQYYKSTPKYATSLPSHEPCKETLLRRKRLQYYNPTPTHATSLLSLKASQRDVAKKEGQNLRICGYIPSHVSRRANEQSRGRCVSEQKAVAIIKANSEIRNVLAITRAMQRDVAKKEYIIQLRNTQRPCYRSKPARDVAKKDRIGEPTYHNTNALLFSGLLSTKE